MQVVKAMDEGVKGGRPLADHENATKNQVYPLSMPLATTRTTALSSTCPVMWEHEAAQLYIFSFPHDHQYTNDA